MIKISLPTVGMFERIIIPFEFHRLGTQLKSIDGTPVEINSYKVKRATGGFHYFGILLTVVGAGFAIFATKIIQELAKDTYAAAKKKLLNRSKKSGYDLNIILQIKESTEIVMVFDSKIKLEQFDEGLIAAKSLIDEVLRGKHDSRKEGESIGTELYVFEYSTDDGFTRRELFT